ncbi:thioesterase family protein [Caldibacillus thermoamylovorans]
MTFKLNSEASISYVVKKTDLASAWKNDVDVLATPVLLWLAEIACMKVIEKDLQEGLMTVGVGHYNIKHLAPTPEGYTVKITAKLVKQEGKKLLFDVTGHDGKDIILTGQHERAVIHRERFISKVKEKQITKVDEIWNITNL